MRKILCLMLSCIILSICITSILSWLVSAEPAPPSFYAYGNQENEGTRINTLKLSDTNTLILPSTMSDNSVTIFCDNPSSFRVKGALSETDFISGNTIDLAKLCNKDEYVLEFTNDESTYTLKILFAKNLPAIFILSDDPANQGRAWVESDYTKSNQAKGTMIMISPDGKIRHSGKLTQIKGRGNSTWGLPKKPYQIKLDKKADLLNTGDDSNKSKTWVLLANYFDPVGLRNTLALNLGSALGMQTNIQGESIDLYYDGQYRGVYMLTEKVEVGTGRVDVPDLDEINQETNPETDIENLQVSVGNTKNGATYTYCDGLISPSDISGGYLLEIDYEVRALEEVCYIRTSRNNYIVVKSPEYASKEEMDYIATLYQEYEDAVFANGINPYTEKKYSDYIDIRSLACYYMVNEFSKARDCFSSSAYLTKKAGEDKFIMGPLWDYDLSFGKGAYDDYYTNDDPYGFSVLNYDMGNALFNIEEFYIFLREFYKNEFAPLIKDVVLGAEDSVSQNESLHSLKYYENLISHSAQNNAYLWYDGKSWQEEAKELYAFVSDRYNVLEKYFDSFKDTPFKLSENTFYDVLDDSWFFDVVTTASRNSLLKGVGNGFFKPMSVVNRAQAVQAVFNVAGLPDVDYKPIYSDVGTEDWFSDAVIWATTEGYLDKFADGTFKPDFAISREQFIDMLYRLSGSPKVDINYINDFADKDIVTAVNGVNWAVEKNILLGYDNHLNPQNSITRAEMAAILVRYYNQYPSNK